MAGGEDTSGSGSPTRYVATDSWVIPG